MSTPIITNNAVKKMSQWQITESEAINVFNNGTVEKFGNGHTSVSKYSGYEIGVYWIQDPGGTYKILSVWKRDRR